MNRIEAKAPRMTNLIVRFPGQCDSSVHPVGIIAGDFGKKRIREARQKKARKDARAPGNIIRAR
jgi:hypothetical protein